MADYDIGQAFREIEHELIDSMTRNLGGHRAEEGALGYEWAQWQAMQLEALEGYRRRNAHKMPGQFSEINDRIEQEIRTSYNTAQTSQEREILERLGNNIPEPYSGAAAIEGEFFKVNDRKLDALIEATTNDMKKAEHAVLRHTNDQYRKIIFNAQVYANTGAGTYEKALDMACRDFLSAGINCIEYKNGRRVPIDVYAEMALRTASKRAYLQGEGEMRKKWGIHTVILNKRTNACPKCAPFCGKVIVDDVWSGGTAEEASNLGYLLMSECIDDGLYHPNCQDSHTTYFGDFLDGEEDEQYRQEDGDEEDGEPQSTAQELLQPVTEEERKLSEQLYNAQQRENHCERQVQRFERLEEFSFDEDNKRAYRARREMWETKDKEALFDIDETKKKIKEVQEKSEKPKTSHLLRSGALPRFVNYSFDSDDEKESENSTPESVENSGESGIIEARSITSRNLPNGLRMAPNHVLTESEIENLRKDIITIGADESIFKFNEGHRTGYDDVLDEIRVRGDIIPDKDSNHPRDRMSSRAALAHEYYGHRAYRGTNVPNGSWNDEFRASYMAAKNCPNLTEEERRDLILDALERAKEAGVSIKYNDFIRRTLYGY